MLSESIQARDSRKRRDNMKSCRRTDENRRRILYSYLWDCLLALFFTVRYSQYSDGASPSHSKIRFRPFARDRTRVPHRLRLQMEARCHTSAEIQRLLHENTTVLVTSCAPYNSVHTNSQRNDERQGRWYRQWMVKWRGRE